MGFLSELCVKFWNWSLDYDENLGILEIYKMWDI